MADAQDVTVAVCGIKEDLEPCACVFDEWDVPGNLRCKHERKWDLVIRTVFEPNNSFISPICLRNAVNNASEINK